MPDRKLSGVNISKIIRDSFKDRLEDAALIQDSTRYDVGEAWWSRDEDTTNVLLLANTGDLGEVVPRPGDRLEAGDKSFFAISVSGQDGIYWSLECTPALSRESREAAPVVVGTRPAGTMAHLVLSTTMMPGELWRSRWKRGGAAGFGGMQYSTRPFRLIQGLTDGLPIEVESAIIALDGSASETTLTVVS